MLLVAVNKPQMSVTFHRCQFLTHRKSNKGGSDVDNIHHGLSGLMVGETIKELGSETAMEIIGLTITLNWYLEIRFCGIGLAVKLETWNPWMLWENFRFLLYTCSPERGPSGLLDTVGFDNEDVHGKHNGQEAGGPSSTFQAPSTRTIQEQASDMLCHHPQILQCIFPKNKDALQCYHHSTIHKGNNHRCNNTI